MRQVDIVLIALTKHGGLLRAQQILTRAAQGPFYIGQLSVDASSQLLANGINPGGFTQDVLWTDPRNQQGSWRDL
jgi:hypothetical protein